MNFTITGQVSAGKNNIQVTRQGRRYPNPSFQKWAKDAIRQVHSQRKGQSGTLTDNWLAIAIIYTPGDRRIRDAPSIIDAVFHVLEKCEVVKNDKQFAAVMYYKTEVCRLGPRVKIDLRPMPK